MNNVACQNASKRGRIQRPHLRPCLRGDAKMEREHAAPILACASSLSRTSPPPPPSSSVSPCHSPCRHRSGEEWKMSCLRLSVVVNGSAPSHGSQVVVVGGRGRLPSRRRLGLGRCCCWSEHRARLVCRRLGLGGRHRGSGRHGGVVARVLHLEAATTLWRGWMTAQSYGRAGRMDHRE
jgi:hypothetical protein